MRPAYDDCTCWRAKTPDGTTHPAAWLTAHDRIAVTAVDDLHVEGRPVGMVWYTSEDGHAPAPGLCIGLDDVSEIDLPVTRIETVTPLETTTLETATRMVAEALAHPSAIPEGGLEVGVIVGEHEHVEITVARRHIPCDSMIPPEPRFVFSLIDTGDYPASRSTDSV